jgi:hypothetical protein
MTITLPVLMLALLAGAAPSPASPEAALSSLSKLQASKMGVDRAGNFWSWQRQNGEVQVLASDGGVVHRDHLFGASSVDVDSVWGVVGLFNSGRELHWIDWDGKTVSMPLSGPAADVCWIGAFTAVVTPQLAPYRIEIWNVLDRFPVKTLGSEAQIRPVVGATRLRGVLLRYDFHSELLYSLESFTGELQVYRPDGSLAWNAAVENPERKLWEDWLRDVDGTARRNRDIQTPSIFSLKLALSADGSPWIVQYQNIKERTVVLVRPDPKENQTVPLQDQTCPSNRYRLPGLQHRRIWRQLQLLRPSPVWLRSATVGQDPGFLLCMQLDLVLSFL